MGRLDGKVAVISGAARGQGRSHAVALAREGASIVGFDICEPLRTVTTPGSTSDELEETARLVEAEGRSCLTMKADARDLPAMKALAARTMEEFGAVDVLCINHGMWNVAANTWETSEEHFEETVDVMLTGVFKVAKAFIPGMLAADRGGSIILTSSANGFTPQPGAAAYCAAKAGVINMMRVLAFELGPHWIRVNALCPGGVESPMLLEGGTVERAAELNPRYITNNRHLLPIEWLPAKSVSDAVVWLASEESKFVTGVELPIDGGWTAY
ncbi:MAG: mycofactocin-coupled SDR family oxidoreductase [Actinobacteria bacterium]|nr:mycofactocin-coupled SDR family oxidoreductase [Actinomycetota bacterium]